MVFSILNLCNSVGCLAFGFIVGKLGVRRLMLSGSLLGALSYVLMASANRLAMYYLASVAFGVATAMVTNNPLSLIVNNWFAKNRGFLLGIIFAASGLGGTVCDILVGRVMNSYGFHRSLWVTAGIIAVLLLAGVILVWQDTPSRIGRNPYWLEENQKVRRQDTYGLSFEQARKTAPFWLLLAMEMLWGMAIIPVISCIPAHLSDRGLDPLTVSGTIMPVLFVVSAISKFGMGVVYDRFGSYTMIISLGITTTLGTLLLPLIHTKPLAIAMAVFIGGGYAVMTIPAPLLVEEIFGNRAFAAIIGPITAALSCAGAVGTPIANAIFDATGSYNIPFVLHTIMFAAAMVCGLLAVRLGRKKIQFERPC